MFSLGKTFLLKENICFAVLVKKHKKKQKSLKQTERNFLPSRLQQARRIGNQLIHNHNIYCSTIHSIILIGESSCIVQQSSSHKACHTHDNTYVPRVKYYMCGLHIIGIKPTSSGLWAKPICKYHGPHDMQFTSPVVVRD